MKRIKYILSNKRVCPGRKLDEKSIFYIFQKIFERDYGEKGARNVTPKVLKNKILFLEAKNSNWASEVWLNRKEIVEKINKETGLRTIDEIKIKS